MKRLARWLASGRGRDAALLLLFAAIVAWSLLFTVRPAGPAPAAAPAHAWRGTLVVRVGDLPFEAWGLIRPGDEMPGVARVTGVRRVDYAPGYAACLVTLAVNGPIAFTNLRYPFTQDSTSLRAGSSVLFETPRYGFTGTVVDRRP